MKILMFSKHLMKYGIHLKKQISSTYQHRCPVMTSKQRCIYVGAPSCHQNNVVSTSVRRHDIKNIVSTSVYCHDDASMLSRRCFWAPFACAASTQEKLILLHINIINEYPRSCFSHPPPPHAYYSLVSPVKT